MTKETQIRRKLVLDYWLRKIAPLTAPHPDEPGKTLTAGLQRVSTEIDARLLKDVETLGKGNLLAEFIIYLTVFKVLADRYFDDSCNIVVSAGFKTESFKSTGRQPLFFAMPHHPGKLLKEAVGSTLKEVQECLKYREYDYAELQEGFAARNIDESSLLRFGFTCENINLTSPVAERTRFRLHLSKTESDASSASSAALTITFHDSVCSPRAAEQFSRHYIRLLENVKQGLQSPIGELEFLLPHERERLLRGFNAPGSPYPTDKTIVSLFEEQAAVTPDGAAVVGNDKENEREKTLTYRRLAEQSTALARLLKTKGAAPGHMVGLMVKRSLEMIISILAILKTGAAYVPLNPQAPPARTKYMLDECNASLLLTSLSVETGFEKEIIHLDRTLPALPTPSTSRTFPTRCSDFAYVIFTSGSTGTPKGVPITHANLSPLLHWGYRHLGFGPKDRIIQNLSYYFDWSAWEIFIATTTGASLYMVPDPVQTDPDTCVAYILEKAITALHATPSHYQYLIAVGRKLETLKYLFLGAEKLSYELVRRSSEFTTENCRVFNLYGPTECTITASALEIKNKKPGSFGNTLSVPIGLPVANTSLLVLDRDLNLNPENIPGELYIGGDSLAAGYLGDPEKSSRAFIENLYRSSGIEGERLYKTGDLVRRLPGGNIEFLDRIDSQVKIRGYRIETGEIEARLSRYDEVKQAVVAVLEEDNREKYLCAYIVPTDPAGDRQELFNRISNFLLETLPDYMVPSYFMTVEKMPLNPNGKVDYKALPRPDISSATEYIAPANPVEQTIQDIWSAVLGAPGGEIGVTANFFQSGGHSLKAVTMLSKIHKALNVKVPLEELFKNPSIRELARYIQKGTLKERFKAIEPAGEKEYYPLSPAQKRLYIVQQMVPDSTAYNMPQFFFITGHMEPGKLEKAFKNLIARHDSLRTSFHEVADSPVQKVHDKVDFSIRHRAGPEGFVRPFHLTRAPLLRVAIAKTAESKRLLMIDMHHLISDGVSLDIAVREFTSLYRGDTLAPLRLQYKDFSAWQNRGAWKNEIKKQETWWLKQFEGYIPVLNLPLDFPRPPVQRFEGKTIDFEIGKPGTRALNELAARKGITLFILLQAVYIIMLSKTSGQDDIVIGTPVAGRHHADLQQIIGMFVNTLCLRHNPSGEKTFTSFLEEVKEKTLTALENQDYPFEELVDHLDVERDAGRNPLFDTVFTLQTFDDSSAPMPGLILEPYVTQNDAAKFDLTLTAREIGETLLFNLEYAVRLFKEETGERFCHFFKTLVSEITGDPGKKIANIEMIGGGEKEQLLTEFNHTGPAYPGDKTLPGLFEEQVMKTPDNTAVISPDESLTFRELEDRSRILAGCLSEKGVKENDFVGILTERSIEMIVGILGILTAGCAYVPLNPKAPPARNRFILDECRAALLLTTSDSAKEGTFERETVFLDSSFDRTAIFSPPSSTTPSCSDYAYVIFTSGSTGLPRGVPITHANLSPLLHYGYRHLGIGSRDRALQNLSYYFDWSAWEIFITLTSGAALHMLPDDILLKAGACGSYIREMGITVLHATPTQYKYLVEAGMKEKFNTLKFLFLGAEKLTLDLVRRSFLSVSEECRLFNMYGPTECTIISAVLEIPPHDLEQYENLSSVPIGIPVGNTNLFVLDNTMNPCPINIFGELYISGDCVARGYLNNPELTAEKFVSSSLLRFSASQLPSFSLYRTGDLVRWLADGKIEFLGRIDWQVKIRGHRIEPGEIENTILKHEKVKETVVTVYQDQSGENYLCAYLVPPGDAAGGIDAREIKKFLSGQLPGYMIPVHFIGIESIPLNPNGKVDLKALPGPGAVEETLQYTAPRDETEMKLVGIWSEVLGLEKEEIGIDADFFRLGGHSLNATILISKIHKALDVKLPLSDIFTTPTIRGLGQVVGSAKEEAYAALEPAEKKEYYVLSSAQKRLYVIWQMVPQSIAYNMPQYIPLEANPDVDALEDIFRKLIRRHESLRTSFKTIDSEPMQVIHDSVDFSIPILRQGAGEIIRPFNLEQAPLCRVQLIITPAENHVLCVDMHHIISDGVSNAILTDDFSALAGGSELPGLRIQYKDYAEWQNSAVQIEKRRTLEKYWVEQFGDGIPLLDLPTDFPRPAVQQFDGRTLHFDTGSQTAAALKITAANEGVTLYMLLLSACYVWLSRLSSQQDVVIGTPTAGRNHDDLEPIMGMFVNTLPLRNFPGSEIPFDSFLKEVKQNTLEAFEYQDYHFEDLVEVLVIRRDTGRNPLFDFMFSHHNPVNTVPGSGAAAAVSPASAPGGFNFEDNIAKFDLTVVASETKDNIQLAVQYCTHLFNEKTIRRFAGYLKQTLSSIAGDCTQRTADIEILSQKEKQTLLVDFNKQEAPLAADKTVPQLIAHQVRQTPDHIAVVTLQDAITFAQLEERSGRAAQVLVERGAKENEMVGILAVRSIEMIAGILGILKAGCAYVPLNSRAPASRNRFILDECRATLLLTTTGLADAAALEREIIFLDAPFECADAPYTLSPPPLSPSSYAYVIFTSGSTGTPKGVPITHANLSPLLHWGYRHFGFGPGDRILQNLAYYFDWSAWEIFINLSSGGALHMLPDEVLLNSEACSAYIRKHRLTALHATPTQYKYLVEAGRQEPFKSLRLLFIGAETLTLDLVRRSFLSVEKECRVFNLYGPTECTITATGMELSRDHLEQYRYLSSVPIGSPACNTHLLVLDKYDKPCPIGIAGELAIGGDCVAWGYLNNPELTAEKFVKNPFPSAGNASAMGNRNVYRSGDLVRWLEEGTVEFLGRIDQQVKVRGHRIELGEIENNLLRHERVEETVVTVYQDRSGDNYLCAYLVPSGDAAGGIEAGEIKKFLSEQLPDYMIPVHFIAIESLPLNPNGKVDIKALPEPGAVEGALQYTAPRDEIEMKLVEIWSEVLGLEKEEIGIDVDFFHLGGHSLRATALISKIQKELQAAVPLMEIFAGPTIRQLARYIRSIPGEKEHRIVSDRNLVLLKKADVERNIFVVHSGSGDTEEYVQLFKHMTVPCSGWALRAAPFAGIGPRQVRVETLAEQYIEKIKKVQPQGPYFIAGWSLGGLIAFEMVRQLEISGEKINRLMVIDSIAPKPVPPPGIGDFTVHDEIESHRPLLQEDEELEERARRAGSLEEFWNIVADYLEEKQRQPQDMGRWLPEVLVKFFPDLYSLSLRDVIERLNRVRSYDNAQARYVPQGKIETPMIYVGAAESGGVDSEGWHHYCSRPAIFHRVPGDHFSIMHPPGVVPLAAIFDKYAPGDRITIAMRN